MISPTELSKPSISVSSWLTSATLVVAADGPPTPRTAQRIELVDEDDGRRLPAPARTGRAPRRAHADKHLDELQAEMEERYPGLAATALASRVCPCRAGQPATPFGMRAEAAVILRVLQEVDDFDQLGLASSTPRHRQR